MSRWLSASDTAGGTNERQTNPGGIEERRESRVQSRSDSQTKLASLRDAGVFSERLSGGVAALNQRLITVVSPGQGQIFDQAY